MSFKRKLKFSIKETCGFYGNYKKSVFSILFIQITGSLLHWISTRSKKDVSEEFMIFIYYIAAPICLLTIILFLWNLIRSDLKIELDNRDSSNNLIKKRLSPDNNYLENVGRLWELLNEYNYKKEYEERRSGLDFIFPHTYYTRPYSDLDKWKTSLFSNEDLQSLLKEFLSYFKYWNSSKNQILPVLEIKPVFKSKVEFDDNKKNIKSIIDQIANHLN